LDAAVFVAHNARFDWRFLGAEYALAGVPAPGGKPLCTVRLTRRLVPELRHRGLDHVAAFFGVENPARHRAFGDALATAQVLRALIGRAREGGVETLEDLVLLHDRPRHRQVRNAECGMRSIEGSVDRRTTSHCNSALRAPHSALPE
jgi:DNA polymerase-3 subunit epsilon